jgi:nucleoside-diphosphate-sugar epimerase
MPMRIFVAGATGAAGRSLIPLLRDAGHAVTGMTRTHGGRTALDALGVTPVLADVYDGDAVGA